MASSTSPKASRPPLRPMSPHLQIYKPQITSGMSIFHRITGIALACGLPVFVAWLVFVAGGPKAYAEFMSLFHCWISQLLLFGWMFAFFYHFCCGLRHFAWDAGYGLSIKAVYISGYVAIGVSILLTAAVAIKVYAVIP